jgi:hypothetical protein
MRTQPSISGALALPDWRRVKFGGANTNPLRLMKFQVAQLKRNQKFEILTPSEAAPNFSFRKWKQNRRRRQNGTDEPERAHSHSRLHSVQARLSNRPCYLTTFSNISTIYCPQPWLEGTLVTISSQSQVDRFGTQNKHHKKSENAKILIR